MKLNGKFNIYFATLKPYLLMLIFILCILNAGIVRADEGGGSCDFFAQIHCN